MAQSARAVFLILIIAVLEIAGAQAPKFFADDPIQAMPPPLPVGHIAKKDINEDLDLLLRSKEWKRHPSKPAGAVNTLGEVPDSEWFVNRHALHRMTHDELKRGPGSSEPPVPPFTVTGGKISGVEHGFQMDDSKGRHYFVKLDPLKYPELATAPDVIVSKFLYAIGYNVPENEVVDLTIADLHLSGKAMMTTAGDRKRQMTSNDLNQIVSYAPHQRDGSFRIVASLAIEGKNVGPYEYDGVRRDDPNDIVPHEDRRDLRGLYVFAAWLNDTDMKPTNTLDTIVTEKGVRFIRHYQLDFGNSLGSDGDAPKDPRLGHEYLIPTPSAALEQIFTLGVRPAPWEVADFPKQKSVGNFESVLFDPDHWKPSYPNPAFLSRLPDDDYWAAKQVMALDDGDIAAIVETGRYSDPHAAAVMARILAERRDQVGRTFFSKILPLDHFRVGSGELLFDDLAVKYRFHPSRSYELQWSSFDNIQQKHTPIAGGGSSRLPGAVTQAVTGAYFSAAIAAPGDPLKPVTVYIRKEATGYKVVGVDRSW
jgi:hypothetical protein